MHTYASWFGCTAGRFVATGQGARRDMRIGSGIPACNQGWLVRAAAPAAPCLLPRQLQVSELVAYLERQAPGGARESQGARSGGSGDSSSLSSTAGLYDVLVAADVLVYIGDLRPVLRAAARASEPGALFALSTESLERAQGGVRNSAAAGSVGNDAGPDATAADAAGTLGSSSCSTHTIGGGRAALTAGVRLQVTGRYAHNQEYLLAAAHECSWDAVSVVGEVIRCNMGQPIHGWLCVLRRQASG